MTSSASQYDSDCEEVPSDEASAPAPAPAVAPPPALAALAALAAQVQLVIGIE